jgi:hypothetical protein
LTPVLASASPAAADPFANLMGSPAAAAPAPLSMVTATEAPPVKALDKLAALKALAASKGKAPVAEPPVTIAKPKKMTCPGGPALYNKFILTTMKKLKEMEVDLPYQEVKTLAGAYWTKVKTDICFNDESGDLLDQFAQKAAESIATGAENTSNYNNLVTKTKALMLPKPNAGATRKQQKVVTGPNAAANFAKKAGLPNINFSTVKTAGPAPTRKVKLQLATNKPAVTPGRTPTPQKTKGAGGAAAAAAPAAAKAAAPAAAAAYDPFANLFGPLPAASAPSSNPNFNTMNLLGLGQPAAAVPAAAPPAPLTAAPAPAAAPRVSIGASMPTPPVNLGQNNSVREVSINGKKYIMNVATKGLYEKDEESNSIGAWVGYRQNNGTIRYTNAPNDA